MAYLRENLGYSGHKRPRRPSHGISTPCLSLFMPLVEKKLLKINIRYIDDISNFVGSVLKHLPLKL